MNTTLLYVSYDMTYRHIESKLEYSHSAIAQSAGAVELFEMELFLTLKLYLR